MEPLYITAYTLTNALGRGREATLDALINERSGLMVNDFEDCTLETWIGRVQGLESVTLAGDLQPFQCRNNCLAQLTLQQDDFRDQVAALIARYGATRIGVVLGTSTSGILSTELAYRNLDSKTGQLPAHFHYRFTHDIFSVADFVQHALALSGPAFVVSTACSSSAKVFADAYRLMQSRQCDAVLVGGVDSLCMTTLYGFNSLELVSKDICRPADARRSGLSIGEAGGFAILERQPGSTARPLRLLGYGESSDAYHMSTPHPEGLGAAAAMTQALQRAALQADQIDYINLHGTATQTNDAVEDVAVSGIFGNTVPASSTKGWTGHTLGAAGITEAIIACMCVEQGFLPRSLNTREVDTNFKGNILMETVQRKVNRVLSNSFGFGGNNCSLIIGAED